MDKQAHLEAARLAAARDDAEMGVAPAKGGKGLAEIIRDALEGFAKPLAERLRRMDQRISDEHAELIRHVDNELSLAVRDVREVNGDLNRQAERIAGRAAERAVIRLSNEVEELRREIEAMKAERQQLRAVK